MQVLCRSVIEKVKLCNDKHLQPCLQYCGLFCFRWGVVTAPDHVVMTFFAVGRVRNRGCVRYNCLSGVLAMHQQSSPVMTSSHARLPQQQAVSPCTLPAVSRSGRQKVTHGTGTRTLVFCAGLLAGRKQLCSELCRQLTDILASCTCLTESSTNAC